MADDQIPNWTSLVAPEDQAEYARLEALVTEARAVYAPLLAAERKATDEFYELLGQYEKSPNEDLGQRVLAACRAKEAAVSLCKDPYAKLNDVCGQLNRLVVRLLKDKKLRPRASPGLFSGPKGPLKIEYLQGWNEGEPYSEDSRGGIVIGWSQMGFGFGTLTLYQKEDGTFGAQTETLGAEFVRDVLKALTECVQIEE